MPKKSNIGGRKSVKKTSSDDSSKFEKLLRKTSSSGHYSLRLYISGSTPRSTRAVASVRSLCEEYLPGRYDLEVIDIYQQPEHAVFAQIIAAPTLIKQLPLPLRRLIGNLADRKKMLVALNIKDHRETSVA